mmetsp:Transcript_13749/g.40132  ORF Transcript_13749/g.40132 Transcript_13749/m.40132 type:complete len:276 (-) Transcript_13749:1805-2632(-)
MGCIPSSIAGFVRGSFLLVAGILTDSADVRELGKRLALGAATAVPSHAPKGWSPKNVAAMRQELEDFREQLERSRAEGKRHGLARLQRQLREREEELRLIEELALKLEEEEHNYPLPEFMERVGYEGTMNVAVAGGPGTGKSLLVNSMRRVKYGDRGYAPVGVRGSTPEPMLYEFPGEPLVRLWDLPGAGTAAWPRDLYIRTVGLRYFDVVLVLTGCRMTYTDTILLKELRECQVPHFVVRTMVDVDVSSSAADSQESEEVTVHSIREDLQGGGN